MSVLSAIGNWLQRRLFWIVLLLVTITLGWWGFHEARPTESALLSLYRTARLFTLNLDVPDGKEPDPGLWVAAWLAPILLLRGIAELFRDQLHSAARFVVRGRVIVFGAGDVVNAIVRAERLTLWRRWRHAVVVADLNHDGLTVARDLGAWTVATDGLTAASLRKAAVSRSSVVVVMTEDDRRNATIATEVGKILEKGGKGRIYVNVRSPALARTLERRSGLPDMETTPFSPLALAAADVMDALDRADGVLFAGPRAPSVVLFGQGPLVEAFVLELRRRQRVRHVVESGRPRVRPRILLVGPDAEVRHTELKAMLGAELDLLEIEAETDPLTQTVELSDSTARALLSRERSRVLVVAADDLAGGTIALTLARHLGRRSKLALVTEGPDSTFGRHIAERSVADTAMAEIRVYRVPELACSLRRLEDHRGVFRLARALHEATPAAQPWPDVDDGMRRVFRARAERLMAKIGVQLRASAFMAFDPPQVRLLNQLGFDEFTALARAGLAPDLGDLEVLKAVGRRLVEGGQDMAVDAFCQVARLASDKQQLADPPTTPGDRADDIRQLLLLRRAQLGDNDARITLGPTPSGGWQSGEVVVLLGDATASELRELVEWALGGLPYIGTVLAAEGSAIGAVVAHLAATNGVAVRWLPADATAARRQILDLWTARLAVQPGGVRVLVLPDDPTIWPLAHVCHALGAPVAWLPPAVRDDRTAPDRMLLGGGVGVVELPVDRATVRAYLRHSEWPGTAAQRDLIAAALHQAYVGRQGSRPGAATDPAMRPFDQLAPALQDSNRDIVDDIPTKLAIAGLRLCPAADAAWPAVWPDAAGELLAEMEHGRFNAERMLRGWRSGARDTGRFQSPHLIPWVDLHEEYRAYDRAIIADLPAVLAVAGCGAAPPPSGS